MERIFLKYILCLLCVYTITACDKVNDEVPDQPKFTPYVSESYWSVKTEVYVDAPFNAEKIKKELEDNPPALPSDVYYFYMRKLSSALSAERTVSLLNSAREEQWKAYIETTSSIEWSEKYSFIKTDQKTLPSYEHWTFHLMTDKKDTIIAQYDVAFSISQEGKRTSSPSTKLVLSPEFPGRTCTNSPAGAAYRITSPAAKTSISTAPNWSADFSATGSRPPMKWNRRRQIT